MNLLHVNLQWGLFHCDSAVFGYPSQENNKVQPGGAKYYEKIFNK